MSLDYPDRQNWLAVRRTDRREMKRRGRWFYNLVANGNVPYSVGRNAMKRQRRGR